jgi:Secretion system C-terminal sorting domain
MKHLLQFSRKIFLLVCVGSLYFIAIHTNAQTTTWAKPFKPGSSTNTVKVVDVATDGSGNVYTVGSFKGTVNFNFGGAATNLTSLGGFDVFITKHNSAGVLQWAHRIGNTADDEASAIALGNNAVVVGGTFKSINMDIDPGAGVVPVSSVGGSDLFVLNLTGAGVFTWGKRAGGTADELMSDIDINISSSGNGAIYIGGSFSSGLMDFFDPSTNTASHGGYDAFICALTSAGVYKWVKPIGGAGNDIGHKITNDGINSVMICCDILAASTTFDPGSGSNTGTFFGVTSNGIISSFDLSLAGGSFEGFHQFKGTSNAIAAYIFGAKIRVLGSFTGLMDINPSTTVQNIAPAGSRDMFIVDLNRPDGTNTYYTHLQGQGTTGTSQINVTDIHQANSLSANDFFVCGYVVGSADLGGTSAAEIVAPGTSEQGFIVKYNNVFNSTTFTIDYAYENAVAQTTNDNSRTTCFAEDNSDNLILGGLYFSNSTLPNPTIFNPGNLTGLVADPLFQIASMGYLQYISNCTSVTPTIAITASQTTICSGTNVTFSATPTNGGTTPIYQWKVNGTNVGTNAATYSSSTLTNGASVTCVLTSNAVCATTTNATSNAIAITVNPTVTPTVSITASQTTICAGTNVTFTATPTNGGTTPIYQWKRNGTNVGTNSATYSSNALTNGASLTCVVTSNAACATTTSTTSNAIAITVNPAVTPTVAITASQTTICAGTNITFSATPTNGGTTPIYQWKVNGTNVGTNAATYSSNALTNGASVTCALTSNAACATVTSATSNAIAITVNASVTPTVAITASQSTICAGTNVTFTATPTNGGTTPIYQWKRNGTNVGTNSATYSSNALTNGASLTCVITSNAACASTTSATSNAVAITVNPTVTPAVSITASQSTICAGTNVTFTATPTNGGTAPIYQWKVNGTNVGTNAATYSSNSITNGANVTCVLTSNAACATPINITSNSSVITVTSPATPSITINASQTSICSGVTVVFSANASNGGTTPIYQWKINGSNVGTNSNSYSSNTLANNDVVTCNLTSNANCISTANAISNNITMTTSTAVPAISISANQASYCAGASAQFTASATNGGSSPSYVWKVNGVNAGTNASFTSSTLANGDIITCDLTSNAACVNPSTASSLPISAVIIPNVIPTLAINASQTTICDGTEITFTATSSNGGTNPIYQWQVNGSNVGANTTSFASSSLTNGASISCALISDAICASPSNATSNTVNIIVNPIPNTNVTIVNETLTADQAGANYQWLDCSNAFAPILNANSQSYLATSNGSYAVMVTLNGCTDTSACQTISSVGLTKLNQAVYFKVYPNPANTNLYISNPLTEKIYIQLLDAAGKIIYTNYTSESIMKIEMNEIRSGLYIVKINSKNNIYTQKIVKE